MRSEIWVDIKESFSDTNEIVEAKSCSFCTNHEGDDIQKQLPAIREKVQDYVFAHLRKRANELIEQNREGGDRRHHSFVGFWRIDFNEMCGPTAADPFGEYRFSVNIQQSHTDQKKWIEDKKKIEGNQ